MLRYIHSKVYISLPMTSRSTREAQVQRYDSGVIARALSVGGTESPHNFFPFSTSFEPGIPIFCYTMTFSVLASCLHASWFSV
jgi:hypothetical protein